MIRAFQGVMPRVPPTAYVDDAAVVIGDVIIGEHSSVWPCAVVRGDDKRAYREEANSPPGTASG